MRGICTLANDKVYEQVVALLNSIEQNAPGTPVCIYPYDDEIEQLVAEVERRDSVQIYDDQQSMSAWDQFAKSAWDLNPTAKSTWKESQSGGYHRFGTHRRFCAFDGPFDEFIYMDADTLLLDSPDVIWDSLATHDFVVYDFQIKQPKHVYDVSLPTLEQHFPKDYLKTGIFCSGFYGSRSGLFSPEKRDFVLQSLGAGDAVVLYPAAPDQTLLNYMVMRCELTFKNLSLSLPKEQVTGNSVTSPHFKQRGDKLFDLGTQLLYLHYIGLSSRLFSRLAKGENIGFPYRELFLHYRYLHAPHERPTLLGVAKPYNQPPSVMQRMAKKWNRVLGAEQTGACNP